MDKMSDKGTLVKKSAVTRRRSNAVVRSGSTNTPADERPVVNFQSLAKEAVSRKFAKIMKTMAKKSEEGSLSHTKYLFEIGGVKEEIQRKDPNDAEPSLADLLLTEMRRQRSGETPSAADSAMEDKVSANGETGAAESAGHTVERGGDCGAKAQ
jgi:hypothetical protein